MKISQLPDIPREWEIKQVRHIFNIHNGSTPKSGNPDFWNGDIDWITPDDLGSNAGKSITSSRRKITELGYKSCGVSLVPSGSIALSTRAPIGYVALTKMAACVNQGCRILVPKEGFPEYWYYSFISAKSLLVSLGQGTTFMELPRQSLASVALPVPPLDEQKTIAHFLDHKTAQIDALIAKKQSLLDKLAEQRGASINQAVTKGLNDEVPMKESDIAWLGEIPRHWETKRLRFLMTMSGGLTPRTSEPRYWGGDIPWVSPKDMKSERLSSSIDMLTEDALSETTLRLYPPGKVLIVVRGMILAHTFPVAVNEVPVTVNQDMKVLETTMNPEYLAVLLRGIQSLVLSIVEESAHGTKVLRTDLLKNIVLPVPPRVEQDEIVSEVARLSSQIDKMVSTVTAAITKLQEYRSALITNAVTGKIDVRDFCIPTTTEQREVAHG